MEDIEKILEGIKVPEESVLDQTVGLYGYENRHSDIIKFLLKNEYSEIDGLESFLKLIQYSPDGLKKEHLEKADIIRERIGKIDIVIIIPEPKIIIGIENKIYHFERENQVSDYQEFLLKNYPDFKRLMIFLSPSGYSSETANNSHEVPVKSISYQLIKELSDSLRNHQDEHIRSFTILFSEHLEKFIMTNNEQETEIAKLWYDSEIRKKLNIIFKNKPDMKKIEPHYIQKIEEFLKGKDDKIYGKKDSYKALEGEIYFTTEKFIKSKFPVVFILYDYFDNGNNFPCFRVVIWLKEYLTNKESIVNLLKEIGIHKEPTPIGWDDWCALGIPVNEKFPSSGFNQYFKIEFPEKIEDYKKYIVDNAFEQFKKCYEFYIQAIENKTSS